MGAKTSPEMLAALDLVRSGLTPYAAVKALAERGMVITEQAIFQSSGYKKMTDLHDSLKPKYFAEGVAAHAEGKHCAPPYKSVIPRNTWIAGWSQAALDASPLAARYAEMYPNENK